MKKPFVALLLLMGATAMVAGSAFAQTDDVGIKLVNAKMARQLLSSRAARLGTSAGPDPDTVWVGKSYTNHTAPDNYWNIYVGDYLPGTATSTNAFWDFDNSVGIRRRTRCMVGGRCTASTTRPAVSRSPMISVRGGPSIMATSSTT